jgi:hypothetical protein
VHQAKNSITNNQDPLIPTPLSCINGRTCSTLAAGELCSRARRVASNSATCSLKNW